MPSKVDPRAVFCTRLRKAREAAGLSQKDLGIRAELDQFVASARINRYEQGVHEPNVQTAARLAQALNIPLAYFYSSDERLARAILAFSRLPQERQDHVLRQMEEIQPPTASK